MGSVAGGVIQKHKLDVRTADAELTLHFGEPGAINAALIAGSKPYTPPFPSAYKASEVRSKLSPEALFATLKLNVSIPFPVFNTV